MEKLIGREVTMVIEPGMVGVGCATGDIIFTAPYVERDGTANALFLMESTGQSGHKLYALATANPELVHDQPGGHFVNVCLLASSEAALRKLAERFDSLELANNKPTKLGA